MKILFVYPGIATIGFNSYYEKEDNVDAWYIPIGICYLASSVLKEGHEADIMDLRYLKGYDEVENRIRESNCEVVAISFQTPSSKYAYQVAEIAKKHNKIVVGGGIHPTVLPDEVLETGFFDHVVVGEGMVSFPKILGNMEKGVDTPSMIVGEHYKDLDESPFPHYFDLYVDSVIKKRKLAMIFTSRGCPGRCTFCQPVAKKLFGKKVIFRTADNILAEVKKWKEEYDIEHFMIVDDTFLVKKKLVMEFAQKLIDSNLELTWQCNARVNEFEEEMIGLMAKSRCNWICIGFESASQRMLDLMKKGTTVEQGYIAAALCDKYKIGYTVNILVGVPGETIEDYELNLKFVKKINSENISYNCLVPFPGTDIYEECKSNNLLDTTIPWEGYEMGKVLKKGIISSVDYDRVHQWNGKIRFWNNRALSLIEDGIKYEIKGELDKAFDKYHEILTKHPGRYEGYYYTGKIYKKNGDMDKAAQNLEKVKSMLQDFVRFIISQEKNILISTHFHLGEIYFEKKENDLARKEFESCLNINPAHGKAGEYLGRLTRSLTNNKE